MPNAPPDAAIRRFRDDLITLIGEPKGRLGLAVSGGPDSLALLILASAAGFECAAATVDHGLRSESASEAEFVSYLCQKLSVPHQTLKLGKHKSGNVSDWARNARYAALAEWTSRMKCAHLLTAHHADDQLETMIMRLNRSSGVAGLAGIRARRGMVARPLLRWRKAELVELVQALGVEPIDDPTNRDDRFDRARLRQNLAKATWLDPVAASQSAQALAEAEDALEWSANAYVKRRVESKNAVVSFDPKNLPRELVRRIVRHCLGEVQPGLEPRGEALERLLFSLENSQTVTLGDVKCSGGTIWLFTKAPPRRTG
jgi:tRNA(Ile)-lysidine synthase